MAKKSTKNTGVTSSASDKLDPVGDQTYLKGQYRPFLKTEITTSSASLVNRKLTMVDFSYLALLVLVSYYVRLTNLSSPNSVVFDEVHFGGFAKKYILGTYFMDVHPPLAKMLLAAVGLLGGFKGDFGFEKIGTEFPASTPYILMRSFPAILGVGTVILCYLTLRSSGCRPMVCGLTAGLLLVENSNVTISRYILLDSPLLFFIAAAVYSFKKFEIQVPFSFNWFKSLVACGIALGLALSSKWVGLFTVAWCGVGCVIHLWFLIGDLSISPKAIVKHSVARATVLLGIPITLYCLFFSIHFQLLPKEGDGGAFMSSAFRSTLQGNTIPKNIEGNVGLGSVVTIRHLETQGGYLHSHNNFYPTGSKQQQITLYPHLDTNNHWLIEHYNNTTPDNEFIPIQNGMKIRLKHVNTGRRLHSHDEKPPVSERDWQKEASCYGFDGFKGDANDDFVVEIVKKRTKDPKGIHYVRALTTIFRLKHAMTGHYLFSSESKLPEWGFEQQEVTSASQGYRPLTYWYIETNENTRLNETTSDIVNYPKLTFLDKFVEAHKRMWKVNQGLTDHHPWQSDPTHWPLLLRGINYWVKDARHIYFMGNAITWWLSSTALLTVIIYSIVQIIRWQLGTSIADEKHVFNFNYHTSSYFIGWFIHYFPFFIMGRQLFLHHYLPALYFGILTLGHFFDITVSYFARNYIVLKQASYGVIALVLVSSSIFYMNYSPLIYGQPWTKSQCLKAKWLGDWDFDCNAYYTNLSDYEFRQGGNQANSKISSLAVPNNNASPKEAKETPYTPVEKKKNKPQDPAKIQSENKDKGKDKQEKAPQQPEQVAPPVPNDETPKANP